MPCRRLAVKDAEGAAQRAKLLDGEGHGHILSRAARPEHQPSSVTPAGRSDSCASCCRCAGQGPESWRTDWARYFVLDDNDNISGTSLAEYRKVYDKLVASLVRDIDLTRARSQYTTDLVSLNAHAPKTQDIPGARTGR
jgi:hypothetical protein